MSEITQKQLDEIAAVMGEQEVFVVELTKRELDLISAAVRHEIQSNQECYWRHSLGCDDGLSLQFDQLVKEKKALLKAIGRPF